MLREATAREVVEEVIRESGLSRTSVAEAIPGMSQCNLSNLLNRGNGNMSVANLYRVLDVLGYEILVHKMGSDSEDVVKISYTEYELEQMLASMRK